MIDKTNLLFLTTVHIKYCSLSFVSASKNQPNLQNIEDKTGTSYKHRLIQDSISNVSLNRTVAGDCVRRFKKRLTDGLLVVNKRSVVASE